MGYYLGASIISAKKMTYGEYCKFESIHGQVDIDLKQDGFFCVSLFGDRNWLKKNKFYNTYYPIPDINTIYNKNIENMICDIEIKKIDNLSSLVKILLRNGQIHYEVVNKDNNGADSIDKQKVIALQRLRESLVSNFRFMMNWSGNGLSVNEKIQ